MYKDLNPPSNRVVIIGCGSAGLKVVQLIHEVHTPSIITIGIDTDFNLSNYLKTDHYFPVSKSVVRGLLDRNEGDCTGISRVFRNLHMYQMQPDDLVILTAGLGKFTGTSLMIALTRIIKEITYHPVIGIVTVPYPHNKELILCAKKGMNHLVPALDSLIVLEMEQLKNLFQNPGTGTLYDKCSRFIAAEIEFLTTSFDNLTGKDFFSVMGMKGVGVLFYGQSAGPDRAERLAQACLRTPLCEIDYRAAPGCLVLIEGGPGLTRDDARNVVRDLTFELPGHTHIAWGYRIMKNLNENIHAQAIMTGIKPGWFRGSPNCIASVKNLQTG